MSHPPKHTTIRIDGMHCPSCDILVKSQLETLEGIRDVVPDHRSKTVTITHTKPLTLHAVNAVLCEYGYTARDLDDFIVEMPVARRIQEALVIAGILGILYFFAREFGLIPENISGTAGSVGAAFVLGLIASASTCMATTGALFSSFISKTRQSAHTTLLAVLFIVGRLLGYATFGYLLGSLGSLFAAVTRFGSVLNIVIAIFLIIAGLDMLKIVSLSRIFDLLHIQPSRFFPSIARPRAIRGGAFVLGLLTYFLPCGFTISTQAYAVGLGNPWLSAQIMTAFALGTIPSLVLIALLTNIRNTQVYHYFLKVVGVVIVVIGIQYVMSTASLHGFSFPTISKDSAFEGTEAIMQDNKQIVRMAATSSGYSPNKFIVRKGIPVRWEIEGKEIYGCQGSIQSPQAGIDLTYLKEGENVLEFVPKEVGTINFSCSMGMFSGQFKVIDG